MQIEDKRIHELLLTVPSHRIANYIFSHKENPMYSLVTFDFEEREQGALRREEKARNILNNAEAYLR